MSTNRPKSACLREAWPNFVNRPCAETFGAVYSCHFLRPGSYAVEVKYWVEGKSRTVRLPSLEVPRDWEKDLEVPADRD